MSAPTLDQIALAREAVAAPRWKWMPRMQVLYDGEIYYVRWVDEDGWIGIDDRGVNVETGGWRTPSLMWEPDEKGDERPPLPDLDDPATFGCLDALVRGLFDDPYVHLIRYHVHVPDSSGDLKLALWWCLVNCRCEPVLMETVDGQECGVAGPSRAAALVAVLKRMP